MKLVKLLYFWTMEIRPIAYIRTEFPEKFGVPRQSGLAKGLRGLLPGLADDPPRRLPRHG